MTYILIVLLCGINLAPFLLPQLDIWHAQGIFAQACVLVLFSATFFKSPQFKESKNLELGILHLWIGLFTAYICFVAQTHQKYDITHFFPYFNFLCVLILYKAIVQYLNKESIELCLLYVRYALIATLVMAGLQFFGASQFFQMLYPGNHNVNNPVVGFIGNGTHLSGFLGMMVPVFLYFGKREDWLCLVLIGVLFTLTGSSQNDPAMSGFVVGGVLISIWFWVSKKPSLWLVGGVLLVCAAGLLLVKDTKWFWQFTLTNGRIDLWTSYLPTIKEYFITGAGLGSMNAIYSKSEFPMFRHMHMEYIQFLLEIGFVGIICILAALKKFFSYESNNRLELALKLIFAGFCLSCCFNYPAHLWLPSIYAVFAYAAFMALKRGDYARIN